MILSLLLLPLAAGINAQEITPERIDSIAIETILEETVYYGYTSQKRSTVSGSVATISGKELEQTPFFYGNAALTGRLTGYVGSSVRGKASLWSAGPLVVVDGIPCNYEGSSTLDYIAAEEIESVSILKDAASQALYGIRGANGVVVVTTRKGRIGKPEINLRFDQSFQTFATQPDHIGSAEYARLRNQAGYNDGLGANAFFTDEQIRTFESGENRELYPDNNWRKMLFRNVFLMQRLNASISGGNNRVTYFSNINVRHRGGMYHTDQPKYDPNNEHYWFNLRSGIEMQLNRYLSSSLNLNAFLGKGKNTGSESEETIYAQTFYLPPVLYGLLTPQITDPATGEIMDEGSRVVVTNNYPISPFGTVNRSGYQQITNTNIYAQLALKLDMSFITKGLSLTGYYGYQSNSSNTLNTVQSYEKYIRTGSLDELIFQKYGTDIDAPLSLSKSALYFYHVDYKGLLEYNCNFENHSFAVTAFAFFQDLYRVDTGSPNNLPYKFLSSGVEVTYDYDNRYFVKFDLGYSGSEQYDRNNRFTATPAVSVAWNLSNEQFMKRAGWLSLLKLRAAYGKTANDFSGLGRYTYLDNIQLSRGGSIPYLQYNVTETQKANPFLKAEISIKQNYGLDLSLFGKLDLSVDLFREYMNNMVIGATSLMPVFQGIPLSYYPKTNDGVYINKGYEITAGYTHLFNGRLSLYLGGMLSHTQNKVVNTAEAKRDASYPYRTTIDGYPSGQEWGYLIDDHNGNGYFNTQEELEANPLVYEIGVPALGSFKYYDLNNDGIINDKDQAPLGHGSLPAYGYGFQLKTGWKRLELNVLFQGIDGLYSIISDDGITEYAANGVYSSLHRNAWTAERYAAGEPIGYPALSTLRSYNHVNNSFFLFDRSYLRLKNIELSYTLPEKLSQTLGSGTIRMIISGQNLFTWHKIKMKDFEPDASFMSFPMLRYYNAAINIQF
jgi:TonB-linked SusC/RagA family outer membrane protein